MKAALFERYGTEGSIRVGEMPTPKPEAHELLIKVKATTVTAVDSIFRKGNSIFPRMATGLIRPGIPVLGTELSGVVEAVGDQVTGFHPGDEVIADSGTNYGAHAEYVCISEKEPVIKKPENMTFMEAAALSYGGLTALSFLRDSGAIQQGDRVLVIGASGSVGSFAIQLAVHFGAEVTGMCSTANIDLVKSLGADHIIDYTKTAWEDIDQTFDIIFDSVGKYSLKTCRHLLTDNGRYLTTVLSAGSVGDMLKTKMVGKKKSILSFTGLRSAEDKMKDLELLVNLAESGSLKPVIDRDYPLENIEEAFQYVDLGHKKGNVVITVS